ncbi:MAG TPA: hypothetical protein VLI55_04365 [Bryobacteraceae bacterium]|nr:hypothetical protein [Bryobacteraceae bacterium]
MTGASDFDDLDGRGKVLLGEIPDPWSTIAKENFLLGTASASLSGFRQRRTCVWIARCMRRHPTFWLASWITAHAAAQDL